MGRYITTIVIIAMFVVLVYLSHGAILSYLSHNANISTTSSSTTTIPVMSKADYVITDDQANSLMGANSAIYNAGTFNAVAYYKENYGRLSNSFTQ